MPGSLLSLAVAAALMAFLPAGGLLLAFAAVGVGNGLIDVYLNVAAQRVESESGRPVLQWLHASYALGGITGAGLAGALSILGYDYRVALVAVGRGAGAVRRVDAPHGLARGRPRGRAERLLDLRAVPLAGRCGSRP